MEGTASVAAPRQDRPDSKPRRDGGGGLKRDRDGNAKKPQQSREIPRNAYTPMFERFRDELDEHHDRRERVVKVSRDVTALSKKIIFSLQRVRSIDPDLPKDVESEMKTRLQEISKHLSTIAADVQGINRWRYARSMSCIEEFIEAVTFAHYLRQQSLMDVEETRTLLHELCTATQPADEPDRPPAEDDKPESAGEAMDVDEAKPGIDLTDEDFVMGAFDLSGEMMRFATTTAALNGELAGGGGRTIVADMQELGSFFEMLPQRGDRSWDGKMQVMRTSVKKVERLGYGLKVRGSERPKGWMPDTRGESPPASP